MWSKFGRCRRVNSLGICAAGQACFTLGGTSTLLIDQRGFVEQVTGRGEQAQRMAGLGEDTQRTRAPTKRCAAL